MDSSPIGRKERTEKKSDCGVTGTGSNLEKYVLDFHHWAELE